MTGAPSPSKDAARRRQVGLALLAVGAVLLFSSATWFGSGQPVVGVVQVVVALVVAAAGGAALRRSRTT
ncbi:hypothetical protein GB931_21915 [Modestobacter sp. I12A-02628]|uniref:Uncharacterized protein n=1 Tax=Goekera deserti TaxID=2497753 RepID=A0A7K3WJE0_9ACTN|nr:hypothetical protein [Goekera deserti]MPR00532.1 hypothetical protein [Goekera deserti]NDI50468.1 hypothetical protein [Goekera deserti]NEL56564.1 hypothetical protein [Goekera deserti]